MPTIGLLSDSHGRADTTRRAVDLLIQEGAQILAHLGDVGSFQVLDELVAADGSNLRMVETHLVFGNVDLDIAGLDRYARYLGLCVDHPAGRLDLGPVELVFLHGDDLAALSGAVAQGVRYVCHGHSHCAIDRCDGPTRVINPGALFRARRYTVALLDTDRDTVNFYPIAKP